MSAKSTETFPRGVGARVRVRARGVRVWCVVHGRGCEWHDTVREVCGLRERVGGASMVRGCAAARMRVRARGAVGAVRGGEKPRRQGTTVCRRIQIQ